MTREATRDAHSGFSRPAGAWDNPAYERWLSGIEQERTKRLPAVVSIGLVVATVVAAWLTGVAAVWLGWLAELVP